MKPLLLQREQFVPRSLQEVFEFFSRPENLERITPHWMSFQILTPRVEMRTGAGISYSLRVHGWPLKWLSEISVWNPPFEFVDVQLKGPYKFWRHSHSFREADGGTFVTDTVEYSLPFGPLGRMVNGLLVARDLVNIFNYREKRIQALLG